MFFKKSHNWCAIIILVSFFLPWWHIFVSISGYEIIGFMSNVGRLGNAINKEYDASIPFFYYLIYMFPLLSVIILFMSIRDIDTRIFCIFSGVIFTLWFICYFIQVVPDRGADIFKLLGIGMYASIIASLGLILGTFLDPIIEQQQSKTLPKKNNKSYNKKISDVLGMELIYIKSIDKDGPFKRENMQNQLILGTYKKGKLEGPLEQYYSNERLKLKCNYKNGELDGAYETFYADGSSDDKLIYKNGKLVKK